MGIALDETVPGRGAGRPLRGVRGRARALHGRGRSPGGARPRCPRPFARQSAFLTHAVFHRHHSEHEMLRYLHRLQAQGPLAHHLHDPPRLLHHEAQRHQRDAARDLARVRRRSIPSPPRTRRAATRSCSRELEKLARRDHGLRRGVAPAQRGLPGRIRRPARHPRLPREPGRGRIATCASSPSPPTAPTPPARSMAGFKVVVVACDDDGQRRRRRPRRPRPQEHRDRLAALMITYPSTHGVFEEAIREICAVVHDARRAGLHGRREHERPGGAHQPGRHRGRRLPPEPAQDLLHPPRRRRPGHGADRRGRAPGALPARRIRWPRCAARRPRWARFPRPGGAAPASCPSPGSTSR